MSKFGTWKLSSRRLRRLETPDQHLYHPSAPSMADSKQAEKTNSWKLAVEKKCSDLQTGLQNLQEVSVSPLIVSSVIKG